MMAVMAAVARNPAMTKQALIYKNKGSALLRHRLGHDGNAYNDPSQLYQPILGLLTVEIALQNDCGARFMSWYETKQTDGKVVPTYNYISVHAYGELRTIEDKAWLRSSSAA